MTMLVRLLVVMSLGIWWSGSISVVRQLVHLKHSELEGSKVSYIPLPNAVIQYSLTTHDPAS